MLIIGLLLFLFMPVSFMVQGLIHERANRQQDTVREVSEKWGGSQTIAGPILVLPMHNGNDAYFLPEELNIDGNIQTNTKSRGIYDVALYNSSIQLAGKFTPLDFGALHLDPNTVFWDRAYISLGISNMGGISENITVNWNGSDKKFESGSLNKALRSGAHAEIYLNPENNTNYNFDIKLDLKGSENISFIPLGASTKTKIQSDWKDPSFAGARLPDTHTITESGFTAEWSVIDLNRSFTQEWIAFNSNYSGETFDLNTNTNSYNYTQSVEKSGTFGVNLYQPVDIYQKSIRSAKYSMPIIALVFAVFFLIEILAFKRIHPLQYILIGISLVVFYTLLISISEFWTFNSAYLISSIAIVAMNTAFSTSTMKSLKLGLTNGAILTLLYTFIYILIQMEESALLIGSIGSFIILGVIMFITKSINWYGEEL